jgi:hypothetical protein
LRIVAEVETVPPLRVMRLYVLYVLCILYVSCVPYVTSVSYGSCGSSV